MDLLNSELATTLETGRYCSPSLPINDHTCLVCEDTVEDELHFLFDCHLYLPLEEHREMLFQSINPSFIILSNKEKWAFMSNLNVLKTDYLFCKFVFKGFITKTNFLNNL